MSKLTPEQMDAMKKRTTGWLPLTKWGPKCAGCGDDEYRINGYCTIACREHHDDEDIEALLSHIAAVEAERDAAVVELGILKRTVEFQEKEYLREHGGHWGKCKFQSLVEDATTRADAAESALAAVEAERDAARAEAAKLRAALQVISTGGYNSLRTCAASIARSALTTPTQGAQP